MSAEVWEGANAQVAELMARIEQLEAQLASYEARSGFMTAQEMLDMAYAWIDRNPLAWGHLKGAALAAIDQQRRFSIKKELEQLRESPEVVKGDADYKISNSLSPVLVRLLIKEMPELGELATVRPSKVDGALQWR